MGRLSKRNEVSNSAARQVLVFIDDNLGAFKTKQEQKEGLELLLKTIKIYRACNRKPIDGVEGLILRKHNVETLQSFLGSILWRMKGKNKTKERLFELGSEAFPDYYLELIGYSDDQDTVDFDIEIENDEDNDTGGNYDDDEAEELSTGNNNVDRDSQNIDSPAEVFSCSNPYNNPRCGRGTGEANKALESRICPGTELAVCQACYKHQDNLRKQNKCANPYKNKECEVDDVGYGAETVLCTSCVARGLFKPDEPVSNPGGNDRDVVDKQQYKADNEQQAVEVVVPKSAEKHEKTSAQASSQVYQADNQEQVAVVVNSKSDGIKGKTSAKEFKRAHQHQADNQQQDVVLIIPGSDGKEEKTAAKVSEKLPDTSVKSRKRNVVDDSEEEQPLAVKRQRRVLSAEDAAVPGDVTISQILTAPNETTPSIQKIVPDQPINTEQRQKRYSGAVTPRENLTELNSTISHLLAMRGHALTAPSSVRGDSRANTRRCALTAPSSLRGDSRASTHRHVLTALSSVRDDSLAGTAIPSFSDLPGSERIRSGISRLDIDYSVVNENIKDLKQSLSTAVSDFFEAIGTDPSQQAKFVKDPKQDLLFLYKRSFNRSKFGEVYAGMQSTAPVLASQIVQGLIGAFLFNKVFDAASMPYNINRFGSTLRPSTSRLCEVLAHEIYDFDWDVFRRQLSWLEANDEFYHQDNIHPSATQLAKELCLALSDHLGLLERGRSVARGCEQSWWEALFGIIESALILKEKLEVVDATHEFLWFEHGEKFDSWRMKASQQPSGSGEHKVAFTILPGIHRFDMERESDAADVKAWVVLQRSTPASGSA